MHATITTVALVTLMLSLGITSNASELVIMAMAPFRDEILDPSWHGGPALIPAARLAVDHINNRSDILPGITLRLLEADSGCQYVDKTRVNFTNQLLHHSMSPKVVGMVGPGCSESALALSSIIRQLNLIQVSIATTPRINNSTFKNSFRTIGSSLVYVNAFDSLIHHEDVAWTRVGAVYDKSRRYHISTYQAFRSKVGDDVLQLTYEISGTRIERFVTDMIASLIRVVFVFAPDDSSREILCLAYKNGLIYPNAQFLFVDRVREDFISKSVTIQYENETTVTCTIDDMNQALNGVFLVNNRLHREDTDYTGTTSGMSFNDFNVTYFEYFDMFLAERDINISDVALSGPQYASVYYDAVWALALALNLTTSEFDNMEELQLVRNSEKAENIANSLRANLESLSFEGISGHIEFDPVNRDTPTIGAVLNQCDTTDCRMVGLYNGTLFYDEIDGNESIESDYEVITYQVPLYLGITVILVAALMTVLLVAVQVTLCKYSYLKEVKATSPHMNHLIFSGCYLFIVILVVSAVRETFSPILAPLPVLYAVTCSTLYWSFAMGFTLIFGTVAAKTWRLYKIFGHFKQGPVRYVSDKILTFMVVILLAVDIAMLTAWNVFDPWQVTENIGPMRDDMRVKRLQCTCNHFAVWVSALFTYKGILAALVVSLSILVKQIKRKAFKSTRRIIVMIYLLIINFFIGFTLFGVFLESIPILSFVSLSLCFVVAVVVVALSLFLNSIRPVVQPVLRRERSFSRYRYRKASRTVSVYKDSSKSSLS